MQCWFVGASRDGRLILTSPSGLDEKSSGRLQDLDGALLVGHLLAQPPDLGDLFGTGTGLQSPLPLSLRHTVAQGLG